MKYLAPFLFFMLAMMFSTFNDPVHATVGVYCNLIIGFVLIAEQRILDRIDGMRGKIVIETICKIKEELHETP